MPAKMGGWIKLHREIVDHWIFKDSIYLRAWLIILLRVNHEDVKVLIEKELIECKRGQSVMSLQSWVNEFGRNWTMQRVRTFFELLQKDRMLVVEGMRKTTRVTVCNYDYYQGEQQANNKQRTNREQADNNKQEGIKNDKEEEGHSVTPSKTWKTDYQTYKDECKQNFEFYRTNFEFISKLNFLYPEYDIDKSLIACYDFYHKTEQAWRKKKLTKTVKIDWAATIKKTFLFNAIKE